MRAPLFCLSIPPIGPISNYISNANRIHHVSERQKGCRQHGVFPVTPPLSYLSLHVLLPTRALLPPLVIARCCQAPPRRPRHWTKGVQLRLLRKVILRYILLRELLLTGLGEGVPSESPFLSSGVSQMLLPATAVMVLPPPPRCCRAPLQPGRRGNGPARSRPAAPAPVALRPLRPAAA